MIQENTAAVTKMGIKSEIYLITNDGEQASDKKTLCSAFIFWTNKTLTEAENFELNPIFIAFSFL